MPLRGEVLFHDVSFGYVPNKVVLHDIELYAKPGQKIAFVGATGAGKTTITNLINRFYDIQKGNDHVMTASTSSMIKQGGPAPFAGHRAAGHTSVLPVRSAITSAMASRMRAMEEVHRGGQAGQCA